MIAVAGPATLVQPAASNFTSIMRDELECTRRQTVLLEAAQAVRTATLTFLSAKVHRVTV
jgi:hypothetical protein